MPIFDLSFILSFFGFSELTCPFSPNKPSSLYASISNLTDVDTHQDLIQSASASLHPLGGVIHIAHHSEPFWTQDLTSYNKEKMSFALERTYNLRGVSGPGGMASTSLCGTYKIKKYSQPKW